MAEPIDAAAVLTDAAGAYPTYQELVNFLGANQPPIKLTPLREGTLGEYDYNKRYGKTGEIRINSDALRYMRDAPGGLSANAAHTLIHETTHATDRQLDKLFSDYQDDPPTPEMAQFVDAYRKMRWNAKRPNADWKSPPSEALARQLDPKWAAENAGYRAHAGELYAHAVSNTARTSDQRYSQRYRSTNIPLHLDPSLATENSILLDLANRAQKSTDAVTTNFINAFTGYANALEKRYEYTPYFKTDPEKFLPKDIKYPLQTGAEKLLTDLVGNIPGYSNAGNTLPTGNISLDPNSGILPEAVIHELVHSRKANESSAESSRKRQKAVELFGGEDKYRSFLDKMASEIGLDSDALYRLQHAKIIPGSMGRLENELVSTLAGKAAFNVSQKDFETHFTKIHPNAVAWFDSQMSFEKKGKK